MPMTLPWADPNKCEACGGCGKVVRQFSSARYTCGFETKAVTCDACQGSGRKMPVSLVHDGKAAAAGER
jgi:DnaJ-class molecular chaperone